MPHAVIEHFIDALQKNDATGYEQLLTPDAGMRWFGGEAFEVHRPRVQVIERFLKDGARWNDATVTLMETHGQGPRLVVEFRIQATENSRYIEHNRIAILTLQEERIVQLDLYCPAPIPSARRTGYIAPAALSDEELEHLFEQGPFTFDLRRPLPPQVNARISVHEVNFGIGLPDPSTNIIGATRWSEQEADARIEQIIDVFRARNAGFQWMIGPFDTPRDLGARLLKYGIAFAGSYATMARKGLEQIEIAVHPALKLQAVSKEYPHTLHDAVQIMATCFKFPPAEAELEERGWLARFEEPDFAERNVAFVAYLDDVPIGTARLNLQGGRAYLGGAATMPEARGKRVYSTLLHARLEEARRRGYHVAAVDAGPMSQKILERYGFREYARTQVYGWMPVMDANVIRQLVPQE